MAVILPLVVIYDRTSNVIIVVGYVLAYVTYVAKFPASVNLQETTQNQRVYVRLIAGHLPGRLVDHVNPVSRASNVNFKAVQETSGYFTIPSPSCHM